MIVNDLTLGMVDNQRHLIASEKTVRAISYGARRTDSDRTVYRFVTALVMANCLDYPEYWPSVLAKINELEKAA